MYTALCTFSIFTPIRGFTLTTTQVAGRPGKLHFIDQGSERLKDLPKVAQQVAYDEILELLILDSLLFSAH